MIHYQLRCGNGHPFDGWFASSQAFETQRDAGLAPCPVCGSQEVERALMAPAIARSRPSEAATAPAAAERPADGPPAPVALNDERAMALRAALRALHRAVVENGVDVGRRFPEEARRIHYGESEARGIYGEATAQEARELLDEGIEVLALPVLPDERN